MRDALDDCRLRFVQKCRRPPQNTPDLGGPKKIKNQFRKIHGHVTLPKSYQIDELRSQTLQSHVLYTYLPSALKIAPLKRAGGLVIPISPMYEKKGTQRPYDE